MNKFEWQEALETQAFCWACGCELRMEFGEETRVALFDGQDLIHAFTETDVTSQNIGEKARTHFFEQLLSDLDQFTGTEPANNYDKAELRWFMEARCDFLLSLARGVFSTSVLDNRKGLILRVVVDDDVKTYRITDRVQIV